MASGEYIRLSIDIHRDAKIRRLSDKEFRIWTALMTNAGKNQRQGCGMLCTCAMTPITAHDIAAELEIDVRTVKRAIGKMEGLELVKMFTDVDNQSFIILPNFMDWQENISYLYAQRRAKYFAWVLANVSLLRDFCVTFAELLRGACIKLASSDVDNKGVVRSDSQKILAELSQKIEKRKEKSIKTTEAQKKPKRQKPKDPLFPVAKRLLDFFYEQFQKQYNTEYGVVGGRDIKKLKDLLKMTFIVKLPEEERELYCRKIITEFIQNKPDWIESPDVPKMVQQANGINLKIHNTQLTELDADPDSFDPSTLPPDDGTWENDILPAIEKQISQQSYDTWFKQSRGVESTSDKIIVAVPNNFYREWLLNNYTGIIEAVMAEYGLDYKELHIIATQGQYDALMAQRIESEG